MVVTLPECTNLDPYLCLVRSDVQDADNVLQHLELRQEVHDVHAVGAIQHEDHVRWLTLANCGTDTRHTFRALPCEL